MRLLRASLRRASRALGLSLVRADKQHRFDATETVLRQLAHRGYAPHLVIDAGANVGGWTEMASGIFANAEFHLVEPQRGCHEALARFAGPRFTVHHVAVSAPGVTEVQMIGGGARSSGTGAFVTRALSTSPDASTYPATTLDALLAARVSTTDRTLLKLDLEGHEIAALEGASRLLESVECIFTEARFFDVHHSGTPIFGDLVAFLRERRFDLYEIAALSGRRSDGRLRLGDFLFVRRDSPLLQDVTV
jgi:FkbM family methyltransferase